MAVRTKLPEVGAIASFFSHLPPLADGRAVVQMRPRLFPQAGWPSPLWFVNVSAAIPIGSRTGLWRCTPRRRIGVMMHATGLIHLSRGDHRDLQQPEP